MRSYLYHILYLMCIAYDFNVRLVYCLIKNKLHIKTMSITKSEKNVRESVTLILWVRYQQWERFFTRT